MGGLVTGQELKSLFDYDPLTGMFTRVVARGMRHRKGDIAGFINKKTGYIKIGISGKEYRAHRLAFLYMLGYFPPNEVDHINGVRNDNRWINLRPVSRIDNSKNQRRSSRNTSGVTGVNFSRHPKNAAKPWCAKIGSSITQAKSSFAQKYFSTKEAAIEWRKAKEIELNYHKNHGNVIDRISEAKQ